MTDTRTLVDATGQSDGFTFALVGLVGLADAVDELAGSSRRPSSVVGDRAGDQAAEIDSFDLALLGLWWLGSTIRRLAESVENAGPQPSVDTGPLGLRPRDLLR